MVKHYYGFEHSLGGIVVIKGGDFEHVNGYPNFWSWGFEDSCLQKRCLQANFKIDRTHFYKIGSPEILQLFDGVDRIINKKDPHKIHTDTGEIGLKTIHKLHYTIDNTSTNEKDNLYQGLPNHFAYINITRFLSESRFEDDEYYKYDLREPVANITNPELKNRTMHVNTTPDDWGNIPYYPTIQDRKDAAKQQQHRQQPQQPIRPQQQLIRPQQPPIHTQHTNLHAPLVNTIFSQNNQMNRMRGGGAFQNTNTRLGVQRR